MMKKLIFGAAALLLLSCNTDDGAEAPLGSYDNGVLVLNEGGAGTVTFISNDLGLVRQDIFGSVNGPQQDIGQYAQSIFFDGARAFIISNGSNKITVVNRHTFEYLATISAGLSVPRYGAVHGSKAYVTNMASFFSDSDDYVAVIDLDDLTLEATIPMNRPADRIIEGGGKIWVANGAFGSGDAVTVIDPQSNLVTGVVQMPLAPNSLEFYQGTVYVLCASTGQGASLVRIDAQSQIVGSQVSIPELYALNLDIEGGMAYFTAGPKIYAQPLVAATVSTQPFIDTNSTSPYIGYGFAVNDDKVYISEAAGDFASDGKVLVYNLAGQQLAEIPAGLGPNGFYFN